ncbi:MAG: type II toxin-antitoxin system VapC family toxin [Pseudomonadota bacterium]|nr:type II toxin-antitoxin system VapC family toxin [Pseudomonadota bacterium]
MPRTASLVTYVDTSVWCAYCYNEPESPAAVRWLAQAELDRTATALWTHTEFASASGIKLRDKGQSRDRVTKARQAYDAAVTMTNQLDVIADDYLYAAELCRTSPAKLRAGDALHLAVALRHHCQALASLDNDMNVAAQHFGLQLTVF